jgi:hypothetical protein
MATAFRLIGFNIREHHFSTESDVLRAAGIGMDQVRLLRMRSNLLPWMGPVYEVGHFRKRET